MRRLASLFLVACLLFFGCGNPTAVEQTFTLGEPFWLARGKRAVSSDGSTTVRFAAVVGEEVVTRLNGSPDPITTPLQEVGRTVDPLSSFAELRS